MDARETVKRAVEFRHPAWVPYFIDVVPHQLEGHYPPAQIEALKTALKEAGACEANGHFYAQPLFAPVNPTPTSLPEPFRPLSSEEWVDEWGVIWTCHEFPRVSGHPLEEGWDRLTDYKFPDPRAPGRYASAKETISRYPERYRLGHVWFTLFERLWFLRGFNNMLIDPYVYPEEFSYLQERIVEFNLASIEEQLRLGVDGIFFSDDWGTQESLLMNPDDWRRWYKPQYKRMFDLVHAGGAHVWMHLCGNVMAIIPDLIEIGLNVLNPVQPQAMDVDVLAARFGGRLCFYGGVDVQGTLPRGTVADVENEVRHLIHIFGRYSGGYIGSTSHSILPDTPPENIIALFRAFRDHSGWNAACKA